MLPSMLKLKEKYGLYIDGKWKDASDNAVIKTYCPATGDFLAECADASKEDVDAAVKAAQKAFISWSKTTPKERAAILNKVADIIDANKEELALIESADNGKPLRETRIIDIPYASAHFRYFAGVILAEEGSAQVLANAFLSIDEDLTLLPDVIKHDIDVLNLVFENYNLDSFGKIDPIISKFLVDNFERVIEKIRNGEISSSYITDLPIEFQNSEKLIDACIDSGKLNGLAFANNKEYIILQEDRILEQIEKGAMFSYRMYM